jgi:ubiquinone/menaquinone biosynthesis C-methylase UbiE
LVAQAEYWRDSLILPSLPYRKGQHVLDIGCGVGAVLGVIGSAFPGLRLHGIDLNPGQLEYARAHLAALGHKDADLRQGDAADLPWEVGAFDHVFMMWFLEHTPDATPFIEEARRVLRVGGTITIVETDYSFSHVWPLQEDVAYLFDGQRDLFRKVGVATTGRSLGAMLAASGFREVKNGPVGFHHFTPGDTTGLRAFVGYLLGFLGPMVPRLVSELGRDEAQLRRGLEALRGLPDQPAASLTQIVFRARGVR